MKSLTLFLACLALSATAAAADAPRLMLWATDSMGTPDGAQCALPTSPSPALPASAPTLTEQDVTTWDARNARWTLNPTKFTPAAIVSMLQDHCYLLVLDGKLISSGVLLSGHSARLTGFDTISVYTRNNAPYLQLTSGNHGSHSRLIHVDALQAVLGQRTEPTQATNQ
jgi:hypothetical protein